MTIGNLDDIARRLAEPMPRRRALRLAGGAVAAVVLPGARIARGASLIRSSGECGPDIRACPHVVQGAVGPDKCCGAPARRYTCTGSIYDPVCVDTCPDPVRQCPSDKKDDDGYSYFTCCPPGEKCVDGDCVANCDAGTVQCGKNCCPEGCCDRIFTLKAAYCCSEEDADKGPWKDAEVAAIIAGIALGGLALTVASGGTAAIVLAGLATGVSIGGVAAKIAGDDPPDPRYKEPFRPKIPRVATIRPGAGVSPAAARALNALIANRLRTGAYVLAWIRSIEKAQGADKAGDKTWSKRQRKAAAGYAREAARTLERDRSLSTAALRELQHGGFVDTPVTRNQARAWQNRVRQRGLPAETMRVLRAAGVDEPRLAAFRMAVAQLDSRLVSGVGAFGSLTDRRLAAANAATIKALHKAARA